MRREKATEGGGEQSDEDHQSRSGYSLHLDHEALVGTDETLIARLSVDEELLGRKTAPSH